MYTSGLPRAGFPTRWRGFGWIIRCRILTVPLTTRFPAELSEDAVPGARVRVRFGSQRVTGFIAERAETTDVAKGLQPLLSVLSRIPAVSAEIFDLAEALADRYASTVANVLRACGDAARGIS